MKAQNLQISNIPVATAGEHRKKKSSRRLSQTTIIRSPTGPLTPEINDLSIKVDILNSASRILQC